MNLKALKLYLVTNCGLNQSFEQYKAFIQAAVAGGVTAIQYRDKHVDLATFRARALQLKSLLAPLGVPLIINDYLEIAKEIDADGVHLGQQDSSPQVARELLGPNKIIGWSVESWQELEKANQYDDGLDYLAASAVFPSKSKSNLKMIWGLEGLRELAQRSRYPVLAIGGITKENAAAVMASGACGIAVISAIHDSINPKQGAEELRQVIDKHSNNVIA